MSSPFEPPRTPPSPSRREPSRRLRRTVLPKLLVAGLCGLHALGPPVFAALMRLTEEPISLAAWIVGGAWTFSLLAAAIAAVVSAFRSVRGSFAAGTHPDLAFWRWASVPLLIMLGGLAFPFFE